MSFNIDNALEEWRKELLAQEVMEPGYADEIIASLYDRYDDYLLQGLDQKAAFEKAKKAVSPCLKSTCQEYQKVTSKKTIIPSQKSKLFILLPNYLKTSLRHLSRKKFYNAINYLSLVIGLLFTLLAILYIDYETSFDAFHQDNDQKYRLGREFRSQKYSVYSFDGYYSAPRETQLKQINGLQNIQGVELACHFYTFGLPELVTANAKELAVENLLETNTPTRFFEFFNWKFIQGNANEFSRQLNTVVLTESEAKRFFGDNWAQAGIIGETLRYNDNDFVITGVIENIPGTSHYDFSMAMNVRKINYWGSRSYIKIAENENPQDIAQRIDDNIDKINTPLSQSELFKGSIIQNIRDIHLNSNMLYELKPPGDKTYLYIFGVISSIILLLTISNYTNLSIAMNASRTREIGMRKLFGAKKPQIVKQFLAESLLLSLLSIPLVYLGLRLLIPEFNTFMNVDLQTSDGKIWLYMFGIALLIGLLSGLYPALYLGKKKIIRLFLGNLVKSGGSGVTTRKAIITFQFTLLIGLCSLTLYVNQQLDYIQTADIGFDRDALVYVNLGEDADVYNTFKNEVLKIPGVTGVGTGSPLGRSPFNQTTYKLGQTDEVFDDAYDVYLTYESVKMLGIETSIPDVIENPDNAPKSIVIINETLKQKLMKQFNLTANELLGRRIIEEPEYTDEETGEVGFPFEIGGFFRDINMFSLRERITPMFITAYKEPENVRWAAIGFDTDNTEQLMTQIKAAYKKLNLDKAFYTSYLSQNIEELYKKERRLGSICILFSVVAFFVAVIGLIALTTYLTTLKQKEIGIRKILGANYLQLIKRFNKEYVWLLIIAIIIAAPLTYYGVSQWLNSFAYRIDLNLLIFLWAALITIFISATAVSLITLKVVRTVPVKTLQEQQ
ncbi:MAG: FtsX-like permease family protein [Bacteroidetes bacterium]|jgi:putative ABC transport system permease protein|nr:FtsX-like permease family protein [Bacteroidota bacterium]